MKIKKLSFFILLFLFIGTPSSSAMTDELIDTFMSGNSNLLEILNDEDSINYKDESIFLALDDHENTNDFLSQTETHSHNPSSLEITYFLASPDEKAIHRSLIHQNCPALFTFTSLKNHYHDEKLRECPIEDCKIKTQTTPRSITYHLIILHHQVPKYCPFDGCLKPEMAFQCLNHELEEHHPTLVENGIFICPECKIKICSSTDLIFVLTHYLHCSQKATSRRKQIWQRAKKSHPNNFIQLMQQSLSSDLLTSNANFNLTENHFPLNQSPSTVNIEINYSEELPIHSCKIHPNICLQPYTYTNLVDHYNDNIKSSNKIQCPVTLKNGTRCQKLENQKYLMVSHLIKQHHGSIPQFCSLPDCHQGSNGSLRLLNHSLKKHHADLIKHGAFICPACKEKICCATDLIEIYNHYGNRNKTTCSNGKNKPQKSFTRSIQLTEDEKEVIETNNEVFQSLEKPVHQCLLHPICSLMTYSNLKEHYFNTFIDPCQQPNCSFKIADRKSRNMWHLIRHHDLPKNCSLPSCHNPTQLQSFNHSLAKDHKECIENGMFICPACKKEICSPTDLITIFQHYRNGHFKTCASNAAKPIFRRKIQEDSKAKEDSSEEETENEY